LITSCYRPEEKAQTKKEVKEKPEKSVRRGRDERGRGHGRGRGRGQDVIQSHSIFKQGPTEKMARGNNKLCIQ
jgi:DNA-directed RNA polymerase III subunit RPC4